MSASVISYHVSPAPGGHRFSVQQRVPVAPGSEVVFYMPIWIPGSYMRRDFARFLSRLAVTDADGAFGDLMQQRLTELTGVGARTSARPIATRWRWPPESAIGLRFSSGSI